VEIEPRPATPEQQRERRVAAVTFGEARRDRAAAKHAAAVTERDASSADLEKAKAHLAQWDVAHPDPQRSMFEEIPNV
jgi:hypothetical protein